uniref:Putative ovule protein n=1 Tax=Solanum chacoense TaxID=4108 RepID=A0A0V0HVP1_SOLCH
MSPERKQLLLSQLREKRAESKRQKTFRQSNSTAALTITNSSLSPEQASKCTNVPCTSTRGQHIVTCLFTFELGSTSTTSHVASKLNSRRTANKVKVCITNVWRT